MSDATTQARKGPRPSVVTLSCVFVAVTAFLTLTELVTALMDWGTVGMQEGLRPVVRVLAATGTQVTTTELLQFLRWCALALVPLTVSMLVFAVYAIRGDRAARVATSALATTAALVSMAAGAIIGPVGFLQACMLVVAAGALWSPDAARWYRGEPASAPLATAQPASALPPSTVQLASRPTSVMTAGLLTILGSLAAAAFASLYLVVHTFARAQYVDAMKTGPFGDMVSPQELELAMRLMFWTSVAILPLALAGLLGATALLARRRVGRTTTLCWAWATAALGLALLPLGLLATAGAGAVIALLARDDARQWTAR
ncbi:MAG TPA: hypothetical protein VM093_02740 [Aeromicrobium sp.]|nr:hypothetical protein [Aeromicrobium sp.]